MPQKTKRTPMMEQYFSIKKDYPDCLLFYRLGDFYELFYDDALKAAQILEITLTSRNKNADDPIPMCGVPHHAAKDYIRTLVELGHKVAICEQMEDAKATKGMVKRDVVQVVTPGTFTEFSGQTDNNYLVAIDKCFAGYAVTYVDVSTGELRGTLLNSLDAVRNEFSSLANREIVLQSAELAEELQAIIEYFQLVVSTHHVKGQYSEFVPAELLSDVTTKELLPCFELLLDYLVVTQKRSLSHIQKAEEYHANHSLLMSLEAKRNLELTTTIRAGQKHGSLFWFLDETKTAMGTRQLKKWIEKPLVLESDIFRRQTLVESLMTNFFERADIGTLLKTVYDLERIVGRVSFGSVNARDLLQLHHSLQQIPQIRAIIESLNEPAWETVLREMDALPQLAALIDCAIDPDAPLSLTDGSLIKTGYSDILDTYREAMTNGKQWIAELQQKEREITGIKTLKISYNKVFGYFIEVTKANIQYLDEDRYERKQTLANAERYITPELKEKERIILEAEEKSAKLEYELFIKVREIVKGYTDSLQRLAQAVATVDVIQAFAGISEEYQFVKPVMSFEDRDLQIIDGRHPVVEKVMGRSTYVPNSIQMNQDEHILLITGPNMSGKSTYMRQLALCVILAQMGCFVPAASAKMPIFTKIFTRIGAADDLISGQSTFMVEMLETNSAIRLADQYSLLLFDEIGRGTATYDGMALAEAIITHIHDHIPAKVLFSTHYHELTDLSQKYPGLRNVHVGAVEKDGEVVFLHKIMDGPADKSYGIHVAKLAGMPESLLANAEEILTRLEAMAINHQAELKEAATNISQCATGATEKPVEPTQMAQTVIHPVEPTVDSLNAAPTTQAVVAAEEVVCAHEAEKTTQQSATQAVVQETRQPVASAETIAQLDLFNDEPVIVETVDPTKQAVIDQIQMTNISNMTPLQVMMLVSQWQEDLKGS